MIRYILTNPREALTTFWNAFRGTEDHQALIKEEESRIKILKTAVALYKNEFGVLPVQLKDLCFNNHQHDSWDSYFIRWRGAGTFTDGFGFPYQYTTDGQTFQLESPGMKTALEIHGRLDHMTKG